MRICIRVNAEMHGVQMRIYKHADTHLQACRCASTDMQIRICRRADAGMCTCSRRDAPHTSRQLRKGGCRDTKTRHRLAPSPHYSTDVNGRQAVPMPRHLRPHRIFAALLRKFHGVTAEFSLRPYGIFASSGTGIPMVGRAWAKHRHASTRSLFCLRCADNGRNASQWQPIMNWKI